jgi:hypothetical protein
MGGHLERATAERTRAANQPRDSGTENWLLHFQSEPEFLNFKGALESIPRNQFRQPM